MQLDHRRLVALLCLPAVTIATLATPVSATQIIYRSAEDLSRSSTLVVRGEVESMRSFWNDAHTRILTEVSVNVRAQYKGDSVQRVRLIQMGGVVDNVRMTVAGSLAWTSGEEVLLFLEPVSDRHHRVAGFHQGKLEIHRDPLTGEEFVRRGAPVGVESIGRTTAGRSATDAGLDVEIGEFLRLLQPHLAGEGR